MIYSLAFLKSAKKEWDNLSPDIKKQLKNKLVKRLESPHVAKDKLTGLENCYKIKLRASGYRLVYCVFEKRVVIQVIVIGKRERSEVYKTARDRLATRSGR
ncbi:MAG: type II toxin-antitoxin system RelE/ParE family toxin [Alphaproteobacteria bacterium]